jgi:hypothetical protein
MGQGVFYLIHRAAITPAQPKETPMLVTFALFVIYLYFGFSSHLVIDGLRGLVKTRTITPDDCPAGWPVELVVRSRWAQHMLSVLVGLGGVATFLSNMYFHGKVVGVAGLALGLVLFVGGIVNSFRYASIFRELRAIEQAKEKVAVETIRRAVA